MNCPNCGSELPEGAIFCSVCGTQLVSSQPQYEAPSQGFNGQPQYGAPQGFNGEPQYSAQPQGFNGQPQYSAQPQGFNSQPQYEAQPQGFNGAPQYGAQPQYGAPNSGFGGIPAAGGQPAYNPAPSQGFNINILLQTIKIDKLSLLTLIGAALIFLGAIIPAWVTVKVSFLGFTESQTAGLWTQGGFYVFSAIIFILASLAIVILKFRVFTFDFIEKYKNVQYSLFFIPAVILLLFIIITIAVANAMDEDYYGMAKVYFNFSWYISLIGLCGVIAETVMKFSWKQPYYA